MSINVSVIVPTLNRPGAIQGCLQSLFLQTHRQDQFEGIVGDEGCPGLARNDGAALAHGRFLAFTDDDCHPHPI